MDKTHLLAELTALRSEVAELRKVQSEAEQYRQVIQGGRRLPDADLSQDPAFAAFVLGGLEADRAKLQAFKNYVHRRLDEAGVPTDPNGPHQARGCRIGDRLDLVLAAYSGSTAGTPSVDAAAVFAGVLAQCGCQCEACRKVAALQATNGKAG